MQGFCCTPCAFGPSIVKFTAMFSASARRAELLRARGRAPAPCQLRRARMLARRQHLARALVVMARSASYVIAAGQWNCSNTSRSGPIATFALISDVPPSPDAFDHARYRDEFSSS